MEFQKDADYIDNSSANSRKHTAEYLMRNYCSMCMKLWVSLALFLMKLSLDGRGDERNRKTKHELFVLILIRGRIASEPADCWESC
jgi:hypothetical protein